MLINPFTPTRMASQPDEFFGRTEELRILERAVQQGSVVLDGPIGIGKSSLLSQGVLAMEGFGTGHRAKSVTAVGHKGVVTVDDAALLLLQEFVEVDERQRAVTFKIALGVPRLGLGAEFERKSEDIYRNFVAGRHLTALQRILQRECLPGVLGEHAILMLCIDEADKCPVPLARLVRALVTYTQHQAINSVHFMLAGVSPFFQAMVNEDEGVRRFFCKNITLRTMSEADSTDLLHTKLSVVASQAEKDGIRLNIDPSVIPRIVSLSGGHPHVLQLLGSHLVEHENEDPDGIIDSKDLVNALRRVCYEERSQVYESTFHMLEAEGKLDSLMTLLDEGTAGFPTEIMRTVAIELTDKETIQWLVEHNILEPFDDSYSLVDEFLRIRIVLDAIDNADDQREVEREILQQFSKESLYIEDREFEDDTDFVGYGSVDNNEQEP